MKVDYVEMSLRDFIKHCPDDWEYLLNTYPHFKLVDINDPLYVVRIENKGLFEIGYRSDDWMLGS